MKALFNCSTNIIGGGIKNSALFIKYSLNDPTIKWFYAVSEPVYDLLERWEVDLPEDKFVVFKNSPARDKKAKKKLIQLAEELKVWFVYTMAGPTYVSFPCKHIMGISNPYITHADRDAYKIKGGIAKIVRYYIYTFIQFIYSYRADYYIFQTHYAKHSFHKRSGINNKKLFIVPNAYDNSLLNYFNEKENEPKKDDIIRVFCPGANYIHKGFQFIPGIISELAKYTDGKFKFILTLPKDSILWKHIEMELKSTNLLDYCTNIGLYSYTELAPLLENSDIVFVPSLLETFSASYLEAMCARKKLIVADKAFAKDICGEYAGYLNPKDYRQSAEVIHRAFNNLKLSPYEQELGRKILREYGDQQHRYKKISSLLKTISLA